MDAQTTERIKKIFAHPHFKYLDQIKEVSTARWILKDILRDDIISEKDTRYLEEVEKLLSKLNPRNVWMMIRAPDELTPRWHQVFELFIDDATADKWETMAKAAKGTLDDEIVPIETDTYYSGG
jgi:hypothetical protein